MYVKQERIANISNPRTGRYYCISHVYIDGEYSHDAIEDIDRGLDKSMSISEIEKRKVYSKTAIPTGTYRIDMDTVSGKFGQKAYYKNFCNGKVPRIENVPGYSGILIHRGVDETSSAGCIIVGKNNVVGKVTASKDVFEAMYARFKKAVARGEAITYVISRKYNV